MVFDGRLTRTRLYIPFLVILVCSICYMMRQDVTGHDSVNPNASKQTARHDSVNPDMTRQTARQNTSAPIPKNNGAPVVSQVVKPLPSADYNFIVIKKLPGWYYKYPMNYRCTKYDKTAHVRYTEVGSDIPGFDAVFFTTGPYELEEWEALHRHRPPGQVWVFATQECPAVLPDMLPPKIYRYSTYNWTFNYHSTADINGVYGWYTPFDQPQAGVKNMFKTKEKLVVWVSTNHCDGIGWDRTKFVKDLDKFVTVDMYGGCGTKPLDRGKKGDQILQKYKFFLSLENNCCSEYITEKVWKTLMKFEAVPIVLGATKKEYSKVMPPQSYIHADDFASMEALGSYIKEVAQNQTLYNQYFNWRRLGKAQTQPYANRFPLFKDGACKIVEHFEKTKKSPTIKTFDPYGPTWFGSCYRCGEHGWIQDYNIWWKQNMYHKVWQAKRTLYWQK